MLECFNYDPCTIVSSTKGRDNNRLKRETQTRNSFMTALTKEEGEMKLLVWSWKVGGCRQLKN